MEFVNVVTYQNHRWKYFWLGPITLFRPSIRSQVYKYKESLLTQQGSKCNYCGEPIRINPGSNCDCDHIIPVNYGGNSEIDNLQLLCVSCHRIKSGMERRKQTRVISVEGLNEERLYACFGEEAGRLSGRVQPRDFVKLWLGLYEISSELGREKKDAMVPPKQKKHMINREKLAIRSKNIKTISSRKASVPRKPLIELATREVLVDMTSRFRKFDIVVSIENGTGSEYIFKELSNEFQVVYCGIYKLDEVIHLYMHSRNPIAPFRVKSIIETIGFNVESISRCKKFEGMVMSEHGDKLKAGFPLGKKRK